MNKKEFFELIKSILDEGNTVEFAINDPENKGVIVNEWTLVEDCGVQVPYEWLGCQTVSIDEDVAWEVVRELGIVYPVIYDESLGEQVQ